MIPQKTVQLIEETAKIEEVVGDFLTLKRRGASYVACCPFHNEKTPSFYVTPSKGIYKCFGCGKAGTAIGFVMEYEHCSYTDALKYLGRKYHIEIEEVELTPEEIMGRQRRESLMIVTEFAHKFFCDQLKSGEGKSVGMAYFHKRGLEDGTIEKFGLGWAPSSRRALTDAALAAGHKLEYLIDAGLSVQHEDGSVSDRFRERVMFPIHSVSGRVIAFSGRTLKSDVNAKYVNSPETEIYTKSKALLGIYFAKAEISRQDKCYLVEGNVDVITMQQLGISNVVASCGTSLTVEQIRLIHRFTSNLTILYDGDKAGIHAALRGTDMVLAEGMNVRIVLLPDGEDPDSFGRTHSLAEFQDYIARNEQDFISFKIDLLLDSAKGDPIRKAELINDIADTVAVVPDPTKITVFAQECARRFGIDEKIVQTRIFGTIRKNKTKQEAVAVREDVPQAPAGAQMEQSSTVMECPKLAPLEADLLSFLLKYGQDKMLFETDSKFYVEDPYTVTEFISSALESDDCHFSNSLYRKVYETYLQLYDQGKDQDTIIRSMLDSPDRALAGAVSEIAIEKYEITVKSFSDSLTTPGSWLVNYVPKTLSMYAVRRLEVQLDTLTRQLASANDPAEQMELMQSIVKLQKLLGSISRK